MTVREEISSFARISVLYLLSRIPIFIVSLLAFNKEQIKDAKVILWYGYCSVHQGFNVEQVRNLKKNDPERVILVHPECNYEVFSESHLSGSTSFIVNTVKNAKPGSKFAIGTEINLVNRLNDEYPEIDIISLSPYQCLCTTMYRIRPRWLLASFRAIKEDKPINIIQVDRSTTELSLKALNKMQNARFACAVCTSKDN